MRSFIAIELPPAVRKSIELLQQPLLDLRGLKPSRPDQCHITLKFLGEIDEVQREDFAAALGRIRLGPFEVSLANLGAFPNAKHPKVIWLAVSNTPELAALAAAVDRATAAIELDRPFVPHLTVARAKHGGVRIDPGLVEASVPPCTFTVAEFVFYKSVLTKAGAVYEALRKFALVA